jgi:hypothetical protein
MKRAVFNIAVSSAQYFIPARPRALEFGWLCSGSQPIVTCITNLCKENYSGTAPRSASRERDHEEKFVNSESGTRKFRMRQLLPRRSPVRLWCSIPVAAGLRAPPRFTHL